MSTGDALSEAALAISLVALVISVMQALQQYFSTAEGFRQCRDDVMGSWSKLTESPLDLRNLRYETKFVSPYLMILSPTKFYEKQSDRLFKDGKNNEILPIGHKDLPEGTKDRGKLASARVTWLALLEHIESYQRGLYNSGFEDGPIVRRATDDPEKGGVRSLSMDEWFKDLHDRKENRMSLPAAYKREVSWDFMPPEAMKPFATISLHDLLVLGYRLGLDWTDVKPQEDRLVAQDDSGNDISAARIRGLGLMVQFQHDSGRSQLDRLSQPGMASIKQFNLKDLMVPSPEADKLAFGVVPGDTQLGFDDVVVNSLEDCLDYVGSLSASDRFPKNARERLKASFDKGDRSKSGLDQLMPLISPVLVIPGCRTTRVRRPNEWCHTGIMEVMEGYVVYRDVTDVWRKSESISAERRSTLNWIHERWARLRDNCRKPLVWAAFRDQVPAPYISSETYDVHTECTAELVTRSAELLKMIDKHLMDTLENYIPPPSDDRRPMQVMLEYHLWRALGLRERAEKVPREQVDTHDLKFADAPMFCQMMQFQLEDIHELCGDVVKHLLGRERGPRLEERFHETFEEIVAYAGDMWLIWIFRGLVFNRSCSFVVLRRSGAGGKPYSLIPAQWLYSQIPIHIS